jgi:uncharacterized protein DUF4159
MRRFVVGTILLISALGAGLGARAEAQTLSPSPRAMDRMIAQAADWLRGQQRPNGSWVERDALEVRHIPEAASLLATRALLEAGADPQEPVVARALDYLEQRRLTDPLALSFRCSVWLAAARKDRQYVSKLRKDSTELLRLARTEGPGRPRTLPGVWAAAQAGLEVPQKYWWDLLGHWLTSQRGDGSWSWETNGPGNAIVTAGGVASIHACYEQLLSSASAYTQCRPGNAASLAMQPLHRGLKYLEQCFPSALERHEHPGWLLFAADRIADAGGHRYFGDLDWSQLGTRRLLAMRNDTGAFGGVLDTALATIFLARSRKAVVIHRLRYDGDWNNRPGAPGALTRWLGQTFEGTYRWQIVPLSAPVSQWHDAPILLLSGSKEPQFTDEDFRRLRRFVLEGGTILSVTECDGEGYRRGIRDLCERLFPEYPLTLCGAEHPLRRFYFPLRGKLRLYTVSNGVRPLIVHADEDLSLHWQLRSVASARWAYEAAANVFLYVTDRGLALHAGRDVTQSTAPDRFAARASVTVARLRYEGNYDPEPLAARRFARLMGQRNQVQVDILDPMPAKALPESGADLAWLTGTAGFSLVDEEKQALRNFVSRGGTLLIEAAGGDPGGPGSRGFSDDAEKLLAEMFPDRPLVTLAGTASLYQIPGMEIPFVRWRRATRARMPDVHTPALKAVLFDNRPGVLFSSEDLTAGLAGLRVAGVDGYHPGGTTFPGSAFGIMRNIVLQAGRIDSRQTGLLEVVRRRQADSGVLIRPNDSWQYLGGEHPSDEWLEVGYPAKGWRTGTAGFGYGDHDDETLLPGMKNNYTVFYVRKQFDVPNPGAIGRLALRIRYDDGFIAYLNGREVARSAVGRGKGRRASRIQVHEALASYETFVIPNADRLLRAGVNVLAIEGHNHRLVSSDFTLDPYLVDLDKAEDLDLP